MWVLFREAKRVLRLDITTEGPAPDAHPGHPLLVCCRHAGPGDSFTLIHALMYWYDREPRVVLKDTLQWDPAIDVLLHRLPATVHLPQPGGGAGPGVADQGAGDRARRRRRVRDLPRGRQLHRSATGPGHRPAPQARPRADGGARRADDQRAGPAAGRVPRGPGRRARGGRRPGRAHRPRPPAHRRRPVARAAHGQADRDAVVAGGARRHPAGPRRSDRLAVRLVGARSTPGSRRTAQNRRDRSTNAPARRAGRGTMVRAARRAPRTNPKGSAKPIQKNTSTGSRASDMVRPAGRRSQSRLPAVSSATQTRTNAICIGSVGKPQDSNGPPPYVGIAEEGPDLGVPGEVGRAVCPGQAEAEARNPGQHGRGPRHGAILPPHVGLLLLGRVLDRRLEVDDLGGLVGRRHRLRLVGRVGERLVGAGGTGVVGGRRGRRRGPGVGT